MLGPDAGIVEAGGDRVGVDDLAVVVLQQVGAVAVQHARAAARERCGVLAAGDAVTGRLDAEDAHGLVVADGMRSEEHTSELQSLMRTSYAVSCLNKKKTQRRSQDNR